MKNISKYSNALILLRIYLKELVKTLKLDNVPYLNFDLLLYQKTRLLSIASGF